jgi:hypothetical protein
MDGEFKNEHGDVNEIDSALLGTQCRFYCNRTANSTANAKTDIRELSNNPDNVRLVILFKYCYSQPDLEIIFKQMRSMPNLKHIITDVLVEKSLFDASFSWCYY